jgi:nicotinamidase-related amidase
VTLDRAALVLIDVQRAIDDPSWGRRNNPEAEANIGRLLDHWRARGRFVVHVQHVSREPASTFRPGQPGVELKPATAARPGEPIIVKHTPSAFAATELGALLEARQVRSLVVTGFITNNSVETTARVAATLGFEVRVVADATATFDRRDLDGRPWRAEEVHALSLSNLSSEYATIVSTDDVLRA